VTLTGWRRLAQSQSDASSAYRVVQSGRVVRIVCGDETIAIVSSRVAAEYHIRKIASGAEYVDRHRPITARIQPVGMAELVLG
jgi:hypothetical protein